MSRSAREPFITGHQANRAGVLRVLRMPSPGGKCLHKVIAGLEKEGHFPDEGKNWQDLKMEIELRNKSKRSLGS